MNAVKCLVPCLCIALLALARPSSSLAQSDPTPQIQSRMNLEDVDIQGEAGKKGALFLNRDRFGLDDRVKVRKNFRPELEDAIPKSFGRLPESLIREPASSSAPR